jgi:hypothetical protein
MASISSPVSRISSISTSDVIAWEGEELPRRLWRLRFLDASHIVPLSHVTSGEIVRLHSTVYHQTVLYRVQEAYSSRVSQ